MFLQTSFGKSFPGSKGEDTDVDTADEGNIDSLPVNCKDISD